MARLHELQSGIARLVVAPELGGAIARLGLCHNGYERPVLRPWSGNSEDGLFALAANTLAPFSNRISNGGFDYNGNHYKIPPNLKGEACPIHGDGFQKPWIITAQSANTIRLVLEKGSIGPYLYHAEQLFSLSEKTCKIELTLTNTASEELPFGCGFHPWFPRNSKTALAFKADSVWLEDKNYLPTKKILLGQNPVWDFQTLRKLPAHWLNNAYNGWSGHARIVQEEDLVSVEVTASDNLSYAIVHTTGSICDFLCFEPVSHPVDAHNISGRPGLKILKPGQSLNCWMQLSWDL